MFGTVGGNMTSSINDHMLARLLVFLSVGLLKQADAQVQDMPAPITLDHDDLQNGWEQYSYLCYSAGCTPPRTLPEFIRLLHVPLPEWPVIGDLCREAEFADPLLKSGRPTALCDRLGAPHLGSHVIDLELDDQYFRILHDACKQTSAPDQYSRAREFLVRNPAVDDAFEAIVANGVWTDTVRESLKRCYESIPSACIRNRGNQKVIVICPHCGWPLVWEGSKARCHAGGVCAALFGDLSQSEIWRQYQSAMMRTRGGIQHYVVAPELALIGLYDKLSKEWGLRCTLYPEFDAYDLLVTFADSRRYAVDLKDHVSPVRLAIALHDRTFRFWPEWDKAFYLFPDYRADEGYLREFENYWTPQKDVTFMRVRDFLTKVRQEVQL